MSATSYVSYKSNVVTPGTPLVKSGDGKWHANLCGCFADCLTCCSVCCCHPCTTGQLYERAAKMGIIARLPFFSCMTITLVIFLLETAEFGMSWLYAETHYDFISDGLSNGNLWDSDWWGNLSDVFHGDNADYEPSDHAKVMMRVAEVIGLLSSICVCLIVCTVRSSIRKRDGIPDKCCGPCEDCCCSCLCNPCTQCMLFRHEKTVSGRPYSLCEPTGVAV